MSQSDNDQKPVDCVWASADELYDDAARIVVSSGQASISYLQRRLRIGFSRAARLIDMMEVDGIVSPASGGKAREVVVVGRGAGRGAGGEMSDTKPDALTLRAYIEQEAHKWPIVDSTWPVAIATGETVARFIIGRLRAEVQERFVLLASADPFVMIDQVAAEAELLKQLANTLERELEAK